MVIILHYRYICKLFIMCVILFLMLLSDPGAIILTVNEIVFVPPMIHCHINDELHLQNINEY